MDGTIENIDITDGILLTTSEFVSQEDIEMTTTHDDLSLFQISFCIKVADELSAAAVTRAIENPVPRGMRVPLKIRIKDIVYLMMVICANIGTLLYSLCG